MHLLLGHSQDPWCLSVRTALEALNCRTYIITNPLLNPSRFAWSLNNDRSESRIVWGDELSVSDDDITSVFVRSTGWIDPTGWQPDDLAYMQSETQAALLAWLWSLACPVINRYSSALWYRPRVPLLSWQRVFRHCGIPTSEMLVTNVDQEALDFRKHLFVEGAQGAVYEPLSSDVRYLVTSDKDWSGLAAMQHCTPVCLSYPHGTAQFVCVVGDKVVWEGEPPSEMVALEPALQRFSRASGLVFVELALAPTSKDISVIAVEPHPNFEHFGVAARQHIVDGIVKLLRAEDSRSHKHHTQSVQKECL
ncbi:MAG: hypothetical protein JSS38_11090 [Nitrospira sp.]|nr:hypothetical protein [Nitrospira sp.]